MRSVAGCSIAALALCASIGTAIPSPARAGADPNATPSQAPSSSPPARLPVRINEKGTFTDHGAWMYHTAENTYRNGPIVTGTNENLTMPSPSPSAGDTLAGITLGRHDYDTLRYPMHIALVEKLFAGTYGIPIFVEDAYGLWEFKPGDVATNETGVRVSGRDPAQTRGPMPASGPIPPEDAAAFDFAKGALQSIANLPAAQKNLDNYVVIFVETSDTIWVEFGPRFAAGEAPHLGCQTQLGRDIAIGYLKKPGADGQIGKYLQCL